MSQPFSLNDQDVVRMVQEAATTQDVNLLRGHIYQLATLRKEMASRLSLEVRARADFQKIASSVSEALGREGTKGLSMLLDRNGTIASLRTQLAEQITTNQTFAAELSQLRGASDPKAQQEALRLARALEEARAEINQLNAKARDYEARLGDLPHIQDQLSQERRTVQLLESRLQELSSQQSVAQQPSPVMEAHAAALDESRLEIARLNDELARAAHVSEEAEELRNALRQAQARNAELEAAQADAPTLANPGEITALRERLDAAQQRISELEQARVAAPTAAAGSELDLVRNLFNDQFAGVIADKMRLERTVRDQDEQIRSLTFSADQLSHESADLRASLAERTAELERTQQAANAERANVTALRAQELDLTAKLGALNGLIEAKSAEIQMLEAAAAEQRTHQAEAQNQISSLRNEIGNLTSDKTQLSEVLAATQEQLSKAHLEKASLEDHALELIETIEEHKKVAVQLEGELAKSRIDIESLTLQRQAVEEQLKQVAAERDSLGQALVMANTRVAELTGEIHQLNDTIGNLKQHNSSLTNTIDQTRQELELLIQATEDEALRQHNAQEELRKQLAEQQGQVRQLQSELTSVNRQVERLERRSTLLAEGMRSAQKARNLYRTEAQEMALELRMATQEAARLREQLHDAERANSVLNAELKTSKKVIHLEHPLSAATASLLSARTEESAEPAGRSF